MKAKKIAFVKFVALLIPIMIFTGCNPAANVPSASSNSVLKSNSEQSGLEFGNDVVIVGTFNGSPVDRTPAEAIDDPVQIHYNGSTCALQYKFTATGSSKDTGFLLLIDNTPVPYRAQSEDAPLEYCHTFHIEEEGETCEFTIYFTPPAGASGEEKPVQLARITNPEYKPDLVETSQYGMFNHQVVASVGSEWYRLVYDADCDGFDSSLLLKNVMKAPSFETELLTDEWTSINWIYGGKIDPEELEAYPRQLITFDGQENSSGNQQVQEGSVQITLLLCGPTGLSYNTVFYLDDIPLCTESGQFVFTTTLERGSISTITFDLPAEAFSEGKTFYALSLAENSGVFPEANVTAGLQTPPVYLYQ